ncbi:MAG: hypothetical protein M0P59_09860 [Gallionella sp.]|jgi:hypothetical protein|nr:hypothetical protein [Gallionella sp.]MCK9354450.1 hypothetical protein [Gallionella sp.]
MKISFQHHAVVLAMLAAVLAVPTSAYAQSGKRVCGMYAPIPNSTGEIVGYAGIIVKVDNGNGAKANQACDDVHKVKPNNTFANTAFAPVLPYMTWKNFSSTACENIGKYFTSTDHPDVDMCMYMATYKGNAIVKSQVTPATTPATTTTSYTQ